MRFGCNFWLEGRIDYPILSSLNHISDKAKQAVVRLGSSKKKVESTVIEAPDMREEIRPFIKYQEQIE